MAHYYAQKQFYKNNAPQTPTNYPYQDEDSAERQFHLLCANAIQNNDGNDCTSVEYGTLEHGWIARKFYVKKDEPEPEPPEA